MDVLNATLSKDLRRMFSWPFQSNRQRTIVALESGGEWLKLAHVEISPKGKKIVKLAARSVVLQEDLSKMLVDLVSDGLIPKDSVLVSIPRNLVTVRNLQLPSTDPQELKEMINLQAVKQTPFLKDEIIADYQIVRSNPEGYTDVVLVTTHRSVSNAALKILDDAQLQAEAIRLSSQGVLNTYQMIQGPKADEENEPVAIVDIDSSFSDFMVILNGHISFTKALSVGPAKLLAGGEKEIEKFMEEIQRAVDIYGNEGIGQRISKLVITGAEIDLTGLIPRLREKLRLPVERVSLIDNIPGASECLDLPEGQRGAVSFAAVVGLAWNPDGAKFDLTPQEVRMREALEQKGRALTTVGILVALVLMALTVLISQHANYRKKYIEQIHQEVLRVQPGADEVQAMKKKIKIIRETTEFQNSSLEILSVLHQSIPSDIYLKAITFESGSHLILKGVSKKMSGVFRFLSILEKRPNFHNVKTRHVTRSGKKGGKEESDFEITCLLGKGNEV
jgi:Tfp pilus assembly PilM family ATPase